jgi:histidinol phosphatase-like enzyme
MQKKWQLIILDRDGVINHDSVNFIKTPEEWHALPGSIAAIAELTRKSNANSAFCTDNVL